MNTGRSISALSLTAEKAARLLHEKEISPSELCDIFLLQIKEKEPSVGAFLTVCEEDARSFAQKADTAIKNGTAYPLTGIPFALKDNICTKGIRTTCASRMLESFVPPYDATVARILKDQNAVLLGKLNMDEFSMGSTGENSALGRTVNPIDTSRVAGGSSGGPAAAVAAGEALFALGSDTGGSIRLPCSFCGAVGMSPTYGTVSRYGLIAFASSLDRIGPVTKTVRDNAFVLSELCKKDPLDSTSVGIGDCNLLCSIEDGVSGMHLAVPRELTEDLSPEVREAFGKAVSALEGLGASIDMISLRSAKHALGAYYIISSAEASSNLARYDGVRYGYRSGEVSSLDSFYKRNRSDSLGKEVQGRILLGTRVLSADCYADYYKKAMITAAKVKDEFDLLFSKYDAVISPTSPTVAPLLDTASEDRLRTYQNDIFTVLASIAGIPALSLPCKRKEGELPVGIQIMGRAFDERRLYRIGYALEAETEGCGI